ncbi:hypothetical protein HS961_04725 [Comamonas piscis]|uniref:Uncharacterized protein n=1 Tax=Comamonas piscis TaxID=1562974 RepID=A0A7G5EDV9_9BURK|nr:hypothetical protein [Comamonas piscis]QMV72184.1 hypothetical protein HS961_04725 [Comamonas piscis]WSO34945.1 hypothetical protein VUJ63_04750 [Comamonas piscis]
MPMSDGRPWAPNPGCDMDSPLPTMQPTVLAGQPLPAAGLLPPPQPSPKF